VFGISSVNWDVTWFGFVASAVALLSLLFWIGIDFYFGRQEVPFMPTSRQSLSEISSDPIKSSGVETDIPSSSAEECTIHYRHDHNHVESAGYSQSQRYHHPRRIQSMTHGEHIMA
jgi:hypothetical protein